MSTRLVHLVAAARPNFMKVAPLYHALAREAWCDVQIVHTGQHYDAKMSDAFFRDLNLPDPAHHLGVGSGSHAEQMGRTMMAYEQLCGRLRPNAIIVVGDVNATAACALVGAKMQIPVVHLEAGLRSRDRRMPEEVNRVVTDAIADLLWTPSYDASDNLVSEGIDPGRIECIGNVMIDSFEMLREKIEAIDVHRQFDLDDRPFCMATLHRPSNVDDSARLSELTAMLEHIATDIRLVFAVHPRTRRRLEEFGLYRRIFDNPKILATDPLGYIEFMSLVKRCTIVLTDSGGIQEETTYLGVPCGTLRENTERPITITHGTNRLITPAMARSAVRQALAGTWPKGGAPELWDGRTASRAVSSLFNFLARHSTSVPT